MFGACRQHGRLEGEVVPLDADAVAIEIVTVGEAQGSAAACFLAARSRGQGLVDFQKFGLGIGLDAETAEQILAAGLDGDLSRLSRSSRGKQVNSVMRSPVSTSRDRVDDPGCRGAPGSPAPGKGGGPGMHRRKGSNSEALDLMMSWISRARSIFPYQRWTEFTPGNWLMQAARRWVRRCSQRRSALASSRGQGAEQHQNGVGHGVGSLINGALWPLERESYYTGQGGK